MRFAQRAAGEDGWAHLMSILLFKGTSRRRSWHILNRMETVGGELNAYTTKEETVIYTDLPVGTSDTGRRVDERPFAALPFPDR